jgi:hypothetical protein
MARKPTKLSSHDAASVERERITQRYSLGRTIVRMLAIVAVFYLLNEMIVSLAGRDTFVALKMAFLADFKVALSVVLTGVAALWAIVERWLRYRKVEYLQGRIKDLEHAIDPNRTTSGLTPAGKTHPKDKSHDR